MLHGSEQPNLLINPLKPWVLMSDAVARQRGVWLPRETKRPNDPPLPRRPMKVLPHERRAGQFSVSHDGNYAIAIAHVVRGLDVEKKFEPVLDDGTGPPIHECFLGDREWYIRGEDVR